MRQTGDKIAAVRVNRSVIFLKSRHDAAKAKSMDHSTRRSFLKDLSLGTAAFSVADHQERPSVMPGRPSSGNAQTAASAPANTMAIAAHPGDAFFAMGAPVALSIRLGGHGVFLSLSLGERGSSTIAPARYGVLQREAAQSAAHRLGAQAEFLDYADGEIPASDEAKLAVCDLIRRHKPTLILTHWRGSWHKDHVACYEIANDAIFYPGLPAHPLKSRPTMCRSSTSPTTGKMRRALLRTPTLISRRSSTVGSRLVPSFPCGGGKPDSATTTTIAALLSSGAASAASPTPSP